MPDTEYFLVSFCNQYNETLSVPQLALIEPQSGAVYKIFSGDEYGITGLAQTEQYIFALSQGPVALLVFDKQTFSIVKRYSLPEVRDQHSLTILDNDIYIVSTGSDCVQRYQFDPATLALSYQGVAWQPHDSDATADTHHINSITQSCGNLFVTGFGRKTGQHWSTAKDGYVHNITTDKPVDQIDPIYQPHSLVFDGADIYYCESSTRSIKKNNATLIQSDSGYTRGLVVTDDLIVVGASRGRTVSKSSGIIHTFNDVGTAEKNCAVSIYDRSSLTVQKRIEFIDAHNEIYAILPLRLGQLPERPYFAVTNLSQRIQSLRNDNTNKTIHIRNIETLLAQSKAALMATTAVKDKRILELEELTTAWAQHIKNLEQLNADGATHIRNLEALLQEQTAARKAAAAVVSEQDRQLSDSAIQLAAQWAELEAMKATRAWRLRQVIRKRVIRRQG